MPGGSLDWRGWRISAAGVELPLRDERDRGGTDVRVYGLRYRAFVPRQGLHPALPAQIPLTLELRHPRWPRPQRVTLHGWRPDGLAYDGLPADLDDAAERRAQRLVHAEVAAEAEARSSRVPALQRGAYCLDLRGMA